MRVVPFEPYHIDVLRAQGVQAAQQRSVSQLPASYASVARPPGPALTAYAGERIIIAGGIMKVGERNGICWALLSEDARHHMVWLHYAVKRFITIERWRRLEATVEETFTAGCRWLDLLGFKFEGRMPGYGDQGETHLRYGRT